MMKNNMDINNLVNRIKAAKTAYYYSPDALMSDEAFDALMNDLKLLDPNHPELTAIATPVPETSKLTKRKHTVFTNSLNKVDSEAELHSWYQPSYGPILVQYKADGSTIVIYYKDGILSHALTRGGDDSVGEDVTSNVLKFKNVPKILPSLFTGGVRGEAILTREDFLKVDPTGQGNERNIGNGLVRRLDGVDAEYMTFIAFNYQEDNTDILKHGETDKIYHLMNWGFRTIESTVCNTVELAINLYREIGEKRKNNLLPYKIDGVVFKIIDPTVQNKLGFSSGRPKYEVVLKYESQGAETVIQDVILTVGHTGVIKPTASLLPVNIDNTMVKSAQLNNWDIIESMDVAIGDRVYVIKAKDIIPYVQSVVHRPTDRKSINRPDKCPACGGLVGPRVNTDGTLGIDLECKNDDCTEKGFRRLMNWINKTGMLYIGETLLEVLYEMGIKTPDKLYTLDAGTISNLKIGNGILGDSNASKVIAEINKTRSLSLNIFLGSLSIKHLGRRRVELIREKCPGEFDKIDDWLSDKILKANASIDNMAPEIHASIMNKVDLIHALLEHITIVESSPKPVVSSTSNGSLSRSVFVFTGKIESVDSSGKRYTRDRLQDIVIQSGGLIDDKIKKSSESAQYYLVQADANSTSSKTEDAKKKGATIIDEAQFWQLMGKNP